MGQTTLNKTSTLNTTVNKTITTTKNKKLSAPGTGSVGPVPKGVVGTGLARTTALVNAGGVKKVSVVPGPAPAQPSWWQRLKKSVGSVMGSKESHAIEERTLAGQTDFVEDDLTKQSIRTDTDELLEEIGSKKKVSWFSSVQRKSLYYFRKNCQIKAKNMLDDPADEYKYDEKQNQTEAAIEDELLNDQRSVAQRIKEMTDCTTRFMSFKNDENFLKHYRESMGQLVKFSSLTKTLMTISEKDYDKLRKRYKTLKLPSLEDAKQTALDANYIKEWYQAKLESMSNKNHTLLLDRDVKTLDNDALEAKIQDLSTATDADKVALRKFLVAQQKMRKCESLGAAPLRKSNESKFRSWGNSGRTNHLWGIKLFTLKKKGSAIDLKNGVGGFAASLIGDDASATSTMMSQKQDTEEKKGEFKKVESKDDIAVKVGKSIANGKISGKVLKGSYKYRKGGFVFGSNASLGNVEATGNVGATMTFGGEEGFAAEAGLNASVGASLAKGRVKLGYEGDYIGGQLRASGKVLSATASAKAGYGKFKFKGSDGKIAEANGFGVMAEAQAALAEGEIGGSFTFLGVRFSASLAGQLGGAGGTIGAYGTAGKVGCSIGALFGLGFRLNVGIDWTGIKSLIKKKKKQYKKESDQRADMSRRLGIVPPPAPAPAPAPAPVVKKATKTKAKAKGTGGKGKNPAGPAPTGTVPTGSAP